MAARRRRLMRRPQRWIALREHAVSTPHAAREAARLRGLVDCWGCPELFFRAAAPRPLPERRGGLNTPPDRVFCPDEPSTWPLTNRLPRAACRLRAPRAGAVACAACHHPAAPPSVRVIRARRDGCASQALWHRGSPQLTPTPPWRRRRAARARRRPKSSRRSAARSTSCILGGGCRWAHLGWAGRIDGYGPCC